VDLYVANDSTRNFLYRNEGPGADGRVGFRDVGVGVGAAFNDRGLTEAGMGTDAGDVDGDGRFDLFVAHLDFETNTLYHNQGGLFIDATARSGLGPPSMRRVGFGVNLFDVDSDGDLDLFVANGHILDNINQQKPSLSYAQPDQLFLGNGSGVFTLAPGAAGPYFERALVGRGTAVGDIDNDGDPDLLVLNNDQAPVLLQNHIGDGANALILELRSRHGGRHAIGAKATVVTHQGTQVEEVRSGSSYLSQGDLRLHFGLGQGTSIERVEIRWPEGQTETLDAASLHLNAVNLIQQTP
ncbi:MAG: CRTAC1 family protein, partial [Acidobacteriota bacterium]